MVLRLERLSDLFPFYFRNDPKLKKSKFPSVSNNLKFSRAAIGMGGNTETKPESPRILSETLKLSVC